MFCGGSGVLVVIDGVEASAEPSAEADVLGPESKERTSTAVAVFTLFRRVRHRGSRDKLTLLNDQEGKCQGLYREAGFISIGCAQI